MRSACWIVLVLVACSGKKDSGAPPGDPVVAPAAPPRATQPDAANTDRAVAPVADAPAAAGRPLYYDRALTSADLDGRSLRELSLMRNWIFARAGHPFRKAWLRDYFTAEPWYHAVAPADEAAITAVDRANAGLIANREAGFGHDQLIAMKDAIARQAAPSAADQIELALLSTRLGSWQADEGAAAAHRSPLEDPRRLDGLLALDDLTNLSRRDLRILRNTVYARRGRPFKSTLMQQWFGDMAWYQPDPNYTDALLTAIDKKNIHLVRSVEDELGGPLSEHEQKDEEGWFAAS